mmetsp:Transcript_120063/g.218261  ORF Transcript_120063/g.218261 Transcript_120063/m.218261 type:complete len:184 (+) Transcript_120063:3-554(+)
MVTHYQMSALAGFYKVDVLNEVRRFSDANGGFVCEYISSPPMDHPSYREPKKGFKRIQSDTKAIHFACGRDQSLSISSGSLKLPFSAHMLPLKKMGQLAGGCLLGGLVKNSMRVSEEGSPWVKLIEQDKYGLYQRVRECMNSKSSMSRSSDKSGPAITEFDLEELFSRRRFYDQDSRTPRYCN